MVQRGFWLELIENVALAHDVDRATERRIDDLQMRFRGLAELVAGLQMGLKCEISANNYSGGPNRFTITGDDYGLRGEACNRPASSSPVIVSRTEPPK